MEAVRLVREQGWSVRDTARHFGFTHSAVVKWLARAKYLPQNSQLIPTRSSRPEHSPNALDPVIVRRVLNLRAERNQCAEIIHWRLEQEGIRISISSVKRVLRRYGISKYSKWKKWHQYPIRPLPEKPGFLVEIDAVHEGTLSDRLSAYALIDVCSRWGYAEPATRVNSRATTRFVRNAVQQAPFAFKTIQTDHGSEFSKWFTKVVEHTGMSHRHTRVRTPTDNGHIERFIRTLQDECLHRIPRNFQVWKKEIPEFIRYYNTERPHMGLSFKTPIQIIKTVPRY
jgi:transposase InsO family protein